MIWGRTGTSILMNLETLRQKKKKKKKRNSETKKRFSVQHVHLQDGEIQIFYQKYTWLEFKRMGQRKIQGYEYRFVSLVGS